MANITNYLNKIKTAVYGKDVRGAIHDAIKQVYDDASVNHDNANMEVKMARGTHNTLNDRLDNVDEIQAQTNAQLSEIKIEKADNVKVDNVQQQVNNLVLGAVGDGNNAEIIQARVDKNGSSFSTLKDNLDNIKSAIEEGVEKYCFGGWEQGSISAEGDNNEEVAKRIRIRTNNIVLPNVFQFFNNSFRANISSDYSVEFVFYSDRDFTNLIFSTGWLVGMCNIPVKSEYFRIVAKRNDGGNISASAGAGIISVNYKTKSYLINDDVISDRTTYSSTKLESTMVDIYGTHSEVEKEDDRHIIRIKDLEKSFNLTDTSITEDGVLKSVIVDNYMWGGLYSSKTNVELEFAINNNGWILFNKNNDQYYMMPLLGSTRGYKYIIKEGVLESEISDAPMVEVGELWKQANNNTIFTLKKVDDVLEIYMGEGVSSSLIATLNECNILGFLSSSTFNTVLTSCYVTTQENKVLTKGLFQKVCDLEEKIQTGSSATMDIRFKNMKVICSGDSITEKNFRAAVNWVDYIKNWCGFKICTNDGKGGTGLIRPNNGSKCLIDRIDDWDAEYDMILIMGNMNDYSDPSYFTESKLGAMGDKTKDTQYGAIDVTINKLLTKYPNASIGWIISTPRQYLEKYGASSTVAQNGYLWGNTSAFDKASQAIKEVCGKYSIPVLDLYHDSGLRPWNETNRAEYFSCTQSPDGDGVHPNEKGQQKIAYKIYGFIKQYM